MVFYSVVMTYRYGEFPRSYWFPARFIVKGTQTRRKSLFLLYHFNFCSYQ